MKGIWLGLASFVGIAILAQFSLPAALGLAAVLVVVAFFAGLRSTRKLRDADAETEALRPESRTLLRPIRRLHEEIAALVDGAAKGSSVSMLGQEIVSESKRILDQAGRSLSVRDELVRAGKERYTAEKEVAELEVKLSSAATVAEHEALEGALTARRIELNHYSQIETTVTQIDGSLRQAEAALSEMKARLLVNATGERAAAGSDADLRETIGRVKALSISVDEAEQMLKG